MFEFLFAGDRELISAFEIILIIAFVCFLTFIITFLLSSKIKIGSPAIKKISNILFIIVFILFTLFFIFYLTIFIEYLSQSGNIFDKVYQLYGFQLLFNIFMFALETFLLTLAAYKFIYLPLQKKKKQSDFQNKT